MPIYEYLCDSCHHRFEIKQKFSDDALTVCPNCGQRIHRVIQPAKVVFKGSGFYITDHKTGGTAVLDSAKTDAKPTTTETKSTEGASTSEPAAASKSDKSESSSATPAPAAASTPSST